MTLSLLTLLTGSNLLFVCRVAEIQPEHEDFQKLFPVLLLGTAGGMQAGTGLH
jgi:hypothetical protein